MTFASIFLFGTIALRPVTGDTAPITLSEAVHIATEQNPEFLSARQEVAKAEAELQEASVLFPENPVLSGNFGREDFRGLKGDREWNIELEQAVYFPGQRASAKEAAELRLAAAQARFNQEREELARQVAVAYADYLESQERVAVAERALEAIDQVMHAERQRLQAGLIGRLAFGQIAAENARLRAEVLRSRAVAQNTVSQLAVLLALSQGELPPPQWVMPASTPTEVLSPRLEAARLEVKANRANVRAEKFRIAPQVTLRAGLSNEKTDIPQLASTESERIYSVGLSVPLPLWQRRQAETGRARAELAQAELAAKSLERTITANQRAAEAAYVAAERAYQTYEEAAQSQSDAEVLLNRAYSLGEIGLVEYLTGLSRVNQFRLDYAQTKTARIRTWAELLFTRGQAYKIMSQL